MPPELHAWRRDDESAGHSVARIARTAEGWTAHAAEVLAGAEVLACWFRVDLDAGWCTARAEVRVLAADGERTVLLERADREWVVDGMPRADLRGCLDVDVAATPLTNTFPIRRFEPLAVGEARTTPVAWVEVPSLRVLRIEQTYERLGPRAWRYRDADHGAFLLEVDADGVVERYEGFAVRIR